MAQVTIYMDDNLEQKVKELAKTSNSSMSKFIANILEKKINTEWNQDIKELNGSWEDFPAIDDIRGTASDIKREQL